MCDNDRIRRSTAVVILFDLVIVSEIPAEEKMVVSNGGSSCGCSCLADRPCKMLLECKLAMEEVGTAGGTWSLRISLPIWSQM